MMKIEKLKEEIVQFVEQEGKGTGYNSCQGFLNSEIAYKLDAVFDELFHDIPYPLRFNVVSMAKEHVFSYFEVNEVADTQTRRAFGCNKYGSLKAWRDCRCIENKENEDGKRVFEQFDRKYIHTCDGANNTGCIIRNNQGMYGLFKPLYDGMGGGVSHFLTREKENFPYEDVRIQSRPNDSFELTCLVYVKKKGRWGIVDMSFDRELTTLVEPRYATIDEASAQLGIDLVSFDEFCGQYFGPGD